MLRLIFAPDWEPVAWSEAERAKGQAWGLATIASFHTHGTPPADIQSTRKESAPVPEDPKPAVTEALRAAILAGEYAPRQRLVEIDLCERFGTSRFILRSALQELAAQGLVEFQRNRGARVREVSLAEAIEITEVRILLEGLVAARAAERVSKSDTVMLRKIVRDMRTAVEKSELLAYSELNARLHGCDPRHRGARDGVPPAPPAARPDRPAPVLAVPGARTADGIAAAARGDRRGDHRTTTRGSRAGDARAPAERDRGVPGTLGRRDAEVMLWCMRTVPLL